MIKNRIAPKSSDKGRPRPTRLSGANSKAVASRDSSFGDRYPGELHRRFRLVSTSRGPPVVLDGDSSITRRRRSHTMSPRRLVAQQGFEVLRFWNSDVFLEWESRWLTAFGLRCNEVLLGRHPHPPTLSRQRRGEHGNEIAVPSARCREETMTPERGAGSGGMNRCAGDEPHRRRLPGSASRRPARQPGHSQCDLLSSASSLSPRGRGVGGEGERRQSMPLFDRRTGSAFWQVMLCMTRSAPRPTTS